MREPVAQAEIRYKSEEEKGRWYEWQPVDADSVPPWWFAGAEYTWEVVLAFVDAFMQYTWAVDFDGAVEQELVETAGDTFVEKLIRYESGQHRKSQFVSFVRKFLAARLARLIRERWEKAAPPRPQPLPGRQGCTKSEYLPGASAAPPLEETAEGRVRRGRPRSSPNLHPEVESYLEQISREAGRRVTIAEFCWVSGFEDDTVFGFWRRGDHKRCNAGQARRFAQTLSLAPKDFLKLLSQK
ncbi:MAG: hypothetical protein ABSC05_01695 [Candidatus Solibacter sp.]|jgi:hypothetical protein